MPINLGTGIIAYSVRPPIMHVSATRVSAARGAGLLAAAARAPLRLDQAPYGGLDGGFNAGGGVELFADSG